MAKARPENEQFRMIARCIGDRTAEFVYASMPRVSEAMAQGKGQASFTVTAQFRTKRDETIICELKPRERIPLEPVEIKVRLHNGQLALWDETGQPVTE